MGPSRGDSRRGRPNRRDRSQQPCALRSDRPTQPGSNLSPPREPVCLSPSTSERLPLQIASVSSDRSTQRLSRTARVIRVCTWQYRSEPALSGHPTRAPVQPLFHPLDLPRPPRLVEPGCERVVEARDHGPALARDRRHADGRADRSAGERVPEGRVRGESDRNRGPSPFQTRWYPARNLLFFVDEAPTHTHLLDSSRPHHGPRTRGPIEIRSPWPGCAAPGRSQDRTSACRWS
jgi:hypothetical protein